MVCEFYLNKVVRNSSGGAVVKTPRSQCPGSIPGQRTRSHMHATSESSHATTKKPTCRN